MSKTEQETPILSLPTKVKEIISSDVLNAELSRILSRVEIQKSKYYAYRMNKFLEIPLDAVYKDPQVLKLTHNKSLVLQSIYLPQGLAKVPCVTLVNERKILVLNYPQNKQQLYVPQKQLEQKEIQIVNLKEHNGIRKIVRRGDYFIISLETDESLQKIKEELKSQGFKAMDEREMFYFDLVNDIQKRISAPIITNKMLLSRQIKENFIGIHKGEISEQVMRTLHSASQPNSFINSLNGISLDKLLFGIHLQQMSANSNNNNKRHNFYPQVSQPKISPQQQNSSKPIIQQEIIKSMNQATQEIDTISNEKDSADPPVQTYRRKRLLSQGHTLDEKEVSKLQIGSSSLRKMKKREGNCENEEIIYEKTEKSTKKLQVNSLKGVKQVQFKDDLSPLTSKKQEGEQSSSDKKQLDDESSLRYSLQNVNGENETAFTPKITLLQAVINENAEEELDNQLYETQYNLTDKLHPLTTDSFKPKDYSKLTPIDDLEI